MSQSVTNIITNTFSLHYPSPHVTHRDIDVTQRDAGRYSNCILGDANQTKWKSFWFKVKQLIKSYFQIMKDRNYLLLLSSWALIQGFFQTFLILFVRQVRPTLTENVNMNIGYIMLIVFVRNRLQNISLKAYRL